MGSFFFHSGGRVGGVEGGEGMFQGGEDWRWRLKGRGVWDQKMTKSSQEITSKQP